MKLWLLQASKRRLLLPFLFVLLFNLGIVMRLFIITLLLPLLAGCAQNPVTARPDFVMMSENQELALGEYAQRLSSGATVQTMEINGLQAALITQSNATLGVIYFNQRAYLIQGKAKTDTEFAANRDTILSTINGFRALDESKLAKPLVVHVVSAQQDDSFAKLAQHSPLGKSAESYLRLINAHYPDEESQPGELIKIFE
jgi:predicted Zn-dependent protease